ncbi:MAG: lysine--tRNA ligase [Zymomonas mobilis subsp. pomaceae]|uniref:Lysine--tRNA ligase n=1 Tax=Zymomonas mobilis subsp. pomaceae (strain ATCC 29192 / DSM 22645 / JCM 10191 / CCUG 17912 / NBRC 13757 / NCIMB 11200 / NRRL B-4491 / Barker I) TaxID=579138 RepID=F8EUZ0_ZYMMT|nr:lysine--tRNA ligase [Zymomonas mobilis]AEI37278.1 lysyl-tRNA synthetase [Zymomonas mobilis subsp. pomaceae ATCC 29192]MDX5948647.1 lysine--tRNA ligase [Zymomonas mobilis subsp. pomaceae]GEB88452.1 lysine--tRNA ligase [Zymomonas mobilis subsp. pomaceae]
MTQENPLRIAAQKSKAWPFEEARKLLKRYGKSAPEKGYVLFETGYGPSGLPHIGTFNEVLRTTMVRHAYEILSDIPTRLIAFSDDMDGLRKVPDNVPNKAMLTENLGKPLSRIPDPFGKYESFAHHNNAMLRDFLDRFGFEYDFYSASEQYNSGRFDETLKEILRNYAKIMNIMLPTLREERRATYSPILPISEKSGIVLQVPVEVVDAEAGLIRFEDEGEIVEQSILKGKAKLQWKVDWAMRWKALGVDYEMAGKDLIDSVVQSSKITRAIGGRPPEGFNYEMFLDENGEKISKSKGNGISLEEWFRYGSQESLAFFAYREPKKAKSLHLGVIPRAIDEYWQFRRNWHDQDFDKKLGNPVHHIHKGKVPATEMPVPFSLLLNLVSVLGNGADKAMVWGYLAQLLPDAHPEKYPDLDPLIGYAIAYHQDHIAPTLKRRAPTEEEKQALTDLDSRLSTLPADATAEALQTEVYEVGKTYYEKDLRGWFGVLYETLLGSSQGPRMGSFIKLYGIDNSRKLIAEALEK